MKNAPVFFRKCEYILVNGILTNPHDIRGWTDRAERWYGNHLVSATRYEYFAGAMTRFMGQAHRVDELSEVINDITRPLIYVGHSNGCELFSRLIKTFDHKFVAAHLFAAAVDSDFEKNGFNEALRTNRIGSLYIYGSEKDDVLRRGKTLTGWLAFLGLGYGALGYAGVQNVDPLVRDRVHCQWSEDFGHSTWFTPPNIEKSLSLTFRK